MIALSAAFESALARLEAVGYGALSDSERLLATIWWLEGDVNNGGFDQYYFNSGGNFAKLAPGALRFIGAHAAAQIVESANARFGPNGPPESRNERQTALDELRKADPVAFESLDAQFYRYPDDISGLLAASLGLQENV